jgi:Putative oxidoreductase C terminal domain
MSRRNKVGQALPPANSSSGFRSIARAAAAPALLLASVLAADTNYMQSKLIIVDPGHFHATLLQKDMYPWVDPHLTVYAPLGPDLLDYLNRISLFNSRRENPTNWALDIHTGNDPMAEMLRGRAGNIVVFTGRNRAKIDRILAALNAGLNVLADKPWIITSADLPKLEEALALAQRKNLAAYDIMTERYEVTSELQRELVNDRAVFGTLEKGSPQEPAVRARSIHHLMKVVAGTPLRRPPWFFDIDEYGEGLADVGTHVVDLVQWTAFPDQVLDYRTDIEVRSGRRWPGLAAIRSGADIRIVVPEKFRVGHEAHFGQVTNRFFEYVTSPKALPAWETPYMLAKYAVSTKGVDAGRKK